MLLQHLLHRTHRGSIRIEYHIATKYEKLKGLWAKHTYNNNNWTIANTYSTGAIPSGTAPQNKGENRLELSTGMSEDFKAYNIYDLAGNMWEWTTETGTNPGSDKPGVDPTCNEDKCPEGSAPNVVCRGGSFNNTGGDNPVVRANGCDAVDHFSLIIGFRVVLYYFVKISFIIQFTLYNII